MAGKLMKAFRIEMKRINPNHYVSDRNEDYHLLRDLSPAFQRLVEITIYNKNPSFGYCDLYPIMKQLIYLPPKQRKVEEGKVHDGAAAGSSAGTNASQSSTSLRGSATAAEDAEVNTSASSIPALRTTTVADADATAAVNASASSTAAKVILDATTASSTSALPTTAAANVDAASGTAPAPSAEALD